LFKDWYDPTYLMLQELRTTWIPRFFFGITLLFGGGLIGAVALLPLLADRWTAPQPLHLFADDVVVRRSAIAGAVGLIVTAFVFFRPRPTSSEK
jgi:hypothetical protein